MATQPAILGSARLNNFRLGYVPAALATVRETRVIVTLAGEIVCYRRNSIVIHDVANDAPNTCRLVLDMSTPPTRAQRIRITINSDAPRLLFAGALETIDTTYIGRPSTVEYLCMAQDDTPRANRRIPLAYYAGVSATTVAIALVANFAPGFTATHVEAGLPTVTILFDGSEAGMNGCLRALAKQMGGGYFYWEDRDLHFFQTPEVDDPPDDLDTTPNRFLHDPHITMARDDKQVRTRVYGRGHAEATLSDILVGTAQIPVADTSLYGASGGLVKTENQVLTYTGIVVGGTGSKVGGKSGLAPGIPTAAMVAGTAGNLSGGAYRYAVSFIINGGETEAGNNSDAVTITAVTAPGALTDTVVSETSGNLSQGPYSYKVTYVTAAGETEAGTASGGETIPGVDAPTAGSFAGSGTTGGSLSSSSTYIYQVSYVTSSGETPAAAAIVTTTGGSDTAMSLTNIPVSSDSRVTARKIYRSAVFHAKGLVATINNNSSTSHTDTVADNAVGVAPPTADTASSGRIDLTSIPTSADGRVTARRIYRTQAYGSSYKFLTTISGNVTTTYSDNTADVSLGVDAPTVNTSASGQMSLTNIPLGPTGTTARYLYRSPVNVVSNSGYKFLARINNNSTTTYTDNIADSELGDALPLISTVGPQVGDTSFPVQELSVFPAAGWIQVANQVIRYTGRSGSSGAGTLTGVPASGVGSITAAVAYDVTVLNAPQLTGVSGQTRTVIRGTPLYIRVQRDDTAAQAALVAADGEGDGIIEHEISDERMGIATLTALCDADLELHSTELVTVRYASRDVKTKSGKPIVIDIPSPAIDETLTIQEVTIDQLDIAPGLAPRFTVTASSVRFSIEDILRRLATTSLGGT